MIKASMKPVIDIKDICKWFSLDVTDFEFSLVAENKSYQVFDCSAKAEDALDDELIWAQSNGDAFRPSLMTILPTGWMKKDMKDGVNVSTA